MVILFQDDNDGFPVRLTHDDTPNIAFPYCLSQFQGKGRDVPLNTIRLTEEAALKLKDALNKEGKR